MTTLATRLRPLSIAAFALVIVGGCSDSESGGAETSPSTVVATTEAVPTTEVALTTVAPTTTAEPVLVPPVVPAGAFLRGNGLDTFDFGAPAAVVAAGITLAVSSDRTLEFPKDMGDGFESVDHSQYYATQFGRELCWNDGDAGTLCAYFAGVAPESLVFAGWHYTALEGVEGRLFSTSAVTVNILASSNPAITLTGGACFSFTTVEVDGLLVDLLSATGGFGDGIPADTMVTAMSAGNRIISLVNSGDC